MVELEVRTPKLDETTHQVEWEVVSRLRVEHGNATVEGDETLINFGVPVISYRTGEQLRFEDKPEEWARNLPGAYRAGDLVFTVTQDTEPMDVLDEPEIERTPLTLRGRVAQHA